jgi:GR25 family glycosyltransferase involved in LPS biosynthesis
MVIDRKNGWAYVPMTESDKHALHEWAKTHPTLVIVDSLTPQQAYAYRRCLLVRPERERYAMGLRALVETEAGRRFANLYRLSDFDQTIRLLENYPKAREELLDFSFLDAEMRIPVAQFAVWIAERGYADAPKFAEVAPVAIPWCPKVTPVRNNDIYCTYINVDKHAERRERMDAGLVSVGWVASRLSATTPDDIHRWACIEGYDQLPRKRQVEYALAVSHLRALEDIVRSGCGWGLVMEDDLDLEFSRNWAFDMSEIPALLPEDCGIFQMQMIWPLASVNGTNVRLSAPESLAIRSHVPQRDWATGAYLVRREYAQELLHRMKSGEFFEFSAYPGLIMSDVWVYDAPFFSPVYRAYSAPLMVCRSEESTLGNNSTAQALMHRASRMLTQNLAARAGKVKISDVFQPVTPTDYPFVSIITPTYNRRHLLPLLEARILQQSYPRSRMEWILVDDSQDGQPLFTPRENTGLSVKYTVLPEKMVLGAKRNFTLSQAKGNICVYLDDDDYYPPTRVQLAVEALQKRPEVLLAGSTFIPIYFTTDHEFWLGGPWGANHTTAGALAHRRLYSAVQKYDEGAAFAEEKSFLADYKFPLAQMNHLQTIVCFAHESNTFDKRKLRGSNKMKPLDQKITDVVPESVLQEYTTKHENHRAALGKS